VAPAEVVITELLGTGRATRGTGDVATGTRKLLGFLLLLGLTFAAAALVLVGTLALDMAPDTVHDLFLVATNLETVVLAELVENTSSAVAEIVLVLAASRILNLVSLEDLLGLGSARRTAVRDRLLEDMLEEIAHGVGNQGAKGILDLVVKLVLGNEGVDAGLDGSHLWRFKVLRLENSVALLIPLRATSRVLWVCKIFYGWRWHSW
jgi:hypothetical protein